MIRMTHLTRIPAPDGVAPAAQYTHVVTGTGRLVAVSEPALARQIRDEFPDQPILYLSAYPQDVLRNEGLTDAVVAPTPPRPVPPASPSPATGRSSR